MELRVLCGEKSKKESVLSALSADEKSKIINHKFFHEKGNDKIHYSDLVGDIKRHRNQLGGDFVHQHAVKRKMNAHKR